MKPSKPKQKNKETKKGFVYRKIMAQPFFSRNQRIVLAYILAFRMTEKLVK